MQQISILGATGSIGSSTLAVIRNNPHRFQLHSAVAHQNVEGMLAICREFSPKYVVMVDPDAALQLKRRCCEEGISSQILAGEEELIALMADGEIETVVAAIVGAKGLLSSLAAVRAGKRILLANKETLVVGGALFMAEVARFKAEILPIDSEHNALFQCLPKEGGEATLSGVDRLILTASGGPFRTYTHEQLAKVTVAEALAHPNWSMGPKVTIDSSTLMNKGLEFIEAHFLFQMPSDQIEVLIHPQSIIHSLVAYRDGSLLAQLGAADMSIPIAHALGYPDRIPSGAEMLDLIEIGRLDFEAPDLIRFPALRLAEEALAEGASALVALNAANEVLVDAFLTEKIPYLAIAEQLERLLNQLPSQSLPDEEALLAYDQKVRRITHDQIAKGIGEY